MEWFPYKFNKYLYRAASWEWSSRSSPFVQVFGCWLSNHVIVSSWEENNYSSLTVNCYYLVYRDEKIHKMTINFTHNGQKLPFWVKIVIIFKICSALETVVFFSAWDKSRDSSANSQKLEQMEWFSRCHYILWRPTGPSP